MAVSSTLLPATMSLAAEYWAPRRLTGIEPADDAARRPQVSAPEPVVHNVTVNAGLATASAVAVAPTITGVASFALRPMRFAGEGTVLAGRQLARRDPTGHVVGRLLEQRRSRGRVEDGSIGCHVINGIAPASCGGALPQVRA
jgi:hypothetical protein